jgi:hypothetical protein
VVEVGVDDEVAVGEAGASLKGGLEQEIAVGGVACN